MFKSMANSTSSVMDVSGRETRALWEVPISLTLRTRAPMRGRAAGPGKS
jgi:hypothetical protein